MTDGESAAWRMGGVFPREAAAREAAAKKAAAKDAAATDAAATDGRIQPRRPGCGSAGRMHSDDVPVESAQACVCARIVSTAVTRLAQCSEICRVAADCCSIAVATLLT